MGRRRLAKQARDRRDGKSRLEDDDHSAASPDRRSVQSFSHTTNTSDRSSAKANQTLSLAHSCAVHLSTTAGRSCSSTGREARVGHECEGQGGRESERERGVHQPTCRHRKEEASQQRGLHAKQSNVKQATKNRTTNLQHHTPRHQISSKGRRRS